MATPRDPVVARIRGLAAAALAVLGLVALAACGGSGGSGAQSITLYNGQHVQTAQNLVAAFEAATGISVSIRSNDEDTLADQIATEGTHSPADVFLTENSPPLESLQAKGLLAKVEPATLARTPARFSSPQGEWVGVSARVSVLIYNPSLISAGQLPTKVSQLADPQYRGKLAIAPQETDFQPIVTSYLHAYGKPATLSWLKADRGQRERPRLPGQRDDRQPGEPGCRRVRDRQPVLLVADAGGDRRVQHALEDRLLRPG